MAEFTFKCPECGIDIKTDESYESGTAECPHCRHTVMVPMPGIKEGMELGGYILKRLLGVGGMGEVWLAEHPTMQHEVALKILSPALTGSEDFIERFMTEVRLSAKLEHPNIVTTFDADCQKDIYYLAVSFVEGVELQTLLELEKKIDEKKALKIVKALAGALEYAWDEHKILHRDIRPSNIMLDNKGEPHFMDMGISKSMSEGKGLTLTVILIGTPHYMSPEQARAEEELDCRNDIYALGATLYHMVTGSVPYDATTTMGILTKLITDPFPPPQQRNPELSDEIAVLIEIMMAKDADNRQQTWGDVIHDINLVLKGQFPAKKRQEVGKSVIMQETSSQQLSRKKILKNAPKAKFRKNVQQHSEDYSVEQTPKKSKAGLFIGLGLTAVLIIAAIGGLIIFSEEEKTAPPDTKPAKQNKKSNPSQTETKKTEFKPKPKSTPKPKPKPKPKKVQAVRRDATRKNTKEMFEFAVSYAKNNPASFAESIEYFEQVKKNGKGTVWGMKADSEIRRLRNAEKALAEKKRQEKLAGKRSEEKRLATIEKRNFTEIASSLIINGKFMDADKLYQNIKSETLKKELAPTGKILAELAKSKKTILNSFEKQKGKIIAIVLNGKKQKIKIKKVSSKSITAKTKHNKILTSIKFHVNDLAPQEQLKRLKGLSKETKYTYAAVLAIKLKKLSSAEKYFKNTGPLKNILLAKCDELKLGKAEIKAKNELKKIISAAKYLKLSKYQAEQILKKIDDFKKSHANTKIAKNTNTIEKLNELKIKAKNSLLMQKQKSLGINFEKTNYKNIDRKLAKRIHEARTKTGKVLSVNPVNLKNKLKKLKPGMVLRFERSSESYPKEYIEIKKDKIVIEGVNARSLKNAKLKLKVTGKSCIVRDISLQKLVVSGQTTVLDSQILNAFGIIDGTHFVFNSVISRFYPCIPETIINNYSYTKKSITFLHCTFHPRSGDWVPTPIICNGDLEINCINSIISPNTIDQYLLIVMPDFKGSIMLKCCLLKPVDKQGAISSDYDTNSVSMVFKALASMNKSIKVIKCIEKKPVFVNAAKNNFRLVPGSPGRGLGPNRRDLGANIGIDGIPMPYK